MSVKKKKLSVAKLKKAGKILRAADTYAVKTYGSNCYLYGSTVNDFLAGATFVLNLNKKKSTKGKKKK